MREGETSWEAMRSPGERGRGSLPERGEQRSTGIRGPFRQMVPGAWWKASCVRNCMGAVMERTGTQDGGAICYMIREKMELALG